jgi:hypothetical protein
VRATGALALFLLALALSFSASHLVVPPAAAAGPDLDLTIQSRGPVFGIDPLVLPSAVTGTYVGALVTVANFGTEPTSAPVSVVFDPLPPGLTLVLLGAGVGNCNEATLTCTRTETIDDLSDTLVLVALVGPGAAPNATFS